MANSTTNPVAVDVIQDHTIQLSCTANAAFQQRVTASFNADLSEPVAIFTGTGEGVAMTYADQKSVNVFTGAKSKLYVLFEYSSGSGFQKAVYVREPLKAGITTQITSEDATDKDDNDSYFLLADLSSN